MLHAASGRALHLSGAATEKAAVAVGLEELASLPAELQKELTDGLISLDIERIGRIIARISKENPTLGSTLSQYAQTYAFSSILQALRSSEGVQT
ncbi:MAG: hypothetical protein JO138_11410 [Acidobacteriaceae bacterium]|nr:hypothetical protein [Acidobacteriaceae bacterium]